MKSLFLFFCIFSLPFHSNDTISKAPSKIIPITKSLTSFSVVELFTSEGCSSCPPADELIARLQKEMSNDPIYILSFHVDYWDRLGWKDPFSSASNSNRQREYAERFNLSSVYTPQAIINGTQEFVGSEQGNIRNSIQSGLKKSPNFAIQLDHVQMMDHKITFQYHLEGLPQENTSLLVALVQKQSIIHVKRGENEGRTLNHVQIVRNFKSINIGKSEFAKNNQSSELEGIQGMKTNEEEMIAFLQNTKTGAILAATKVTL